MKTPRTRGRVAMGTTSGTCSVCNTVETTDGNICKDCTDRINSICANKNADYDKLLADGIRIGRAKDRGVSVTKAVERLCKSCKQSKQTCQDLRKANRSLKDRDRYSKRSLEVKQRNGFKSKIDKYTQTRGLGF